MWYYGREAGFPGVADSDRTALPCGRSGAAVSPDGLRWEKVDGRGVLGSVLDPSDQAERFDALLIGLTDMVDLGDRWRAYYMGCRRGTAMSYGEERTGWPVAIGVAESADGLGFERVDGEHAGAVLVKGAEGDWDAWYTAFPRVVRHDGGYRMYYSGGGPQGPPAIGLAESSDGLRWEKRGRVLTHSEDPDACDAASVGSRSIVPHEGALLMAYECIDRENNFRIALAASADGVRWERLPGSGPKGSIAPYGAPGTFNDRAIGTPYLVRAEDGSLRLYHVGFGSGGSGIGLLLNDGKDLTRWWPYEGSSE
jgi:hypothetical protein